MSVVLCRYVLQCPKTPPAQGDWVTYREFKDAGPLTGYFTANTNKIIETTFAGDLAALTAACRRAGGRFVEAASFDVAVIFDLLPRVPVYFRFNDRDEEFPAQSSIPEAEARRIGGARHVVDFENRKICAPGADK